MFNTIFLDIYENPGEKNFINPSCPKHLKITEIKNDKSLFQHFFLVPQKDFMKAFWKVKRRV